MLMNSFYLFIYLLSNPLFFKFVAMKFNQGNQKENIEVLGTIKPTLKSLMSIILMVHIWPRSCLMALGSICILLDELLCQILRLIKNFL